MPFLGNQAIATISPHVYVATHTFSSNVPKCLELIVYIVFIVVSFYLA